MVSGRVIYQNCPPSRLAHRSTTLATTTPLTITNGKPIEVIVILPKNSGIRQLKMTKREVVTLSMGAADKALLTDKAADCGYDNLSAFVRAIARGDVALSDQGNLAKRIDKLVDRVNELQAQQQRDRDVFTDDLQRLAATTAP